MWFHQFSNQSTKYLIITEIITLNHETFNYKDETGEGNRVTQNNRILCIIYDVIQTTVGQSSYVYNPTTPLTPSTEPSLTIG